MENFDLMKYMTGDYILQTRIGWKLAGEIQLRPRADVYKLAARIIAPSGEVYSGSWTIEGGAMAGEDNSKFDLMMVRTK